MGSEPEVRVSFGGEIIFNELPLGNLCGHSEADIPVQWAANQYSEATHLICGNCYRKGDYYAVRRKVEGA